MTACKSQTGKCAEDSMSVTHVTYEISAAVYIRDVLVTNFRYLAAFLGIIGSREAKKNC
jgi:hypothetical protein